MHSLSVCLSASGFLGVSRTCGRMTTTPTAAALLQTDIVIFVLLLVEGSAFFNVQKNYIYS